MNTLPPHIPGDEGPVFPPELLEIIIQNLRGSNTTLKQLGLVNRTCLSASRHIIHQSVSVPSELTASFLDLIASPENTYTSTLEAMEIGLDEPTTTTAALIPHLPDFPRLKCIDILPTTFVFTYQFPVLPLITTFSLHAASWHAPTIFHSRADIQVLLASFPGLKSLELGPVRWVYTPSTPSVVPPTRRRELDTLSIPASQMDGQFIATLALDVFALWPRALVVDLQKVELSSQILHGLDTYLRLLGSHLHTLRIKRGTYSSPLEVSSNPALHTITLDLAIHWNYHLGSKDWSLSIPPALPTMLHSLQPQSLDVLVLGVHLHVFRDSAFRFSVVQIEQLGAALEAAPWAGIRRLEVVGAWREHAERGALRDFQAMVIDRLPESVSRRAVVVDSSD
ncbi:hypothetical protein C8R46DRAFT_1128178 [Mycena filopes]|nr:hypothetical protein C8R46DRAFT_1128178 [Mycena filopes]